MSFSISAPGKIILAGEHAVVYGKPALVAAIDKRLTVDISKRKDNEIKIFSNESSGQIKEAIKKFKEMCVTNGDRRLQHRFGLEINVESEIPVKVGMGSSAAVAVATVGALLALAKGIKKFTAQDKNLISKIAYEVEKKIHGTPSGVDNTIAVFGGFLWFKKGKSFKKIKITDLSKFILINTGGAKETTGEMVKLVRDKLESRRLPGRIWERFEEIERDTMSLFLGLKRKDETKIISAINGCEIGLERIGVVGGFAQKIIREIERRKGAAKICGAGGVKDRSGVLLCYHQKPEEIFAIAKRFKLEAFEVLLGEEGVRVE